MPDPNEEDAVLEDKETVRKKAKRPPPVNSEYLPLPWKGRLGYVSPRQANLYG
jgi:UV DNA damage endonuclease